jgi:hypothetical protein
MTPSNRTSQRQAGRVASAALAALAALGALALAAGAAQAADFYLVAKTFDKTMPDGVVVPMWGFAADADVDGNGTGDCFEDVAGACAAAVARSPGPPIALTAIDPALTVFVTNLLDAPVSIVVSGAPLPAGSQPVWTDGASGPRTDLAQRVRSFTHETAPNGGRGSYAWPALAEGTRLYQSGTHPQVQVQMGLYGEVTRPFAAGEYYDEVGYDKALTLFFSEIDPVLHEAVADGSYGTPPGPTSTLAYTPRYFLINGEPWSASSECIRTTPPLESDDDVLLRMLNGGLRELVPMVLESRWLLVGEGGHRTPDAHEQWTALLPPGSTRDALWRPRRSDDFRILERRLNLTNDSATGGGMQACIHVVRNGGDCGVGAELALVLPLLAALRLRRRGR